jgi:hypothetical protein
MRPEHDISGLPKWAQTEIQRLQRNESSYIARLSAGPEDSDTFADPYSDARRPLGKGTSIEFDLDGTKVRVRLDRTHDGTPYLDVNGVDGLAVYPRASNSVMIRVERLA